MHAFASSPKEPIAAHFFATVMSFAQHCGLAPGQSSLPASVTNLLSISATSICEMFMS
jgi:hypothetical protein